MPDQLEEDQANIDRLIGQAQAIEQYLRIANVGACPLPEGVRRLLNRMESAESDLLAERAAVSALTIVIAREAQARQQAAESLTACQAENTRLVHENRRLAGLTPGPCTTEQVGQ